MAWIPIHPPHCFVTASGLVSYSFDGGTIFRFLSRSRRCGGRDQTYGLDIRLYGFNIQ